MELALSSRFRSGLTAAALPLLMLATIPAADATVWVGSVTSPSAPTVEVEVRVDDVASTVEMTFRGPSNRWFAFGFGANTMTGYAIITEQSGSLNFYERNMIAIGNPGVIQAQQDLSLVSDDSAGGVTEFTVTRALNTGDANDFVFPTSAQTVEVIWARGSFDGATSLAYHGATNRSKDNDMALDEDAPTSNPEIASRPWGYTKMLFRPEAEAGN